MTIPGAITVGSADEKRLPWAHVWIGHYFGHTVAEPAGPMVAAFLEYWRDKREEIVKTEGNRGGNKD